MNKLIRIIGLLSLISASFSASAAPVSIINNTAMQLNAEYYYCNDHSHCTFINKMNLDYKGTGHNANNLLFPIGMENIKISSAKAYDKDNNVVATLSSECHTSSSDSNVIILDTFGTKNIYCIYSKA